MSAELIEALREKLAQLRKMRRNLEYSHTKIMPWWRVDANFGDWSEEQLESLAAFKGRFAEFQDHIASAMKLISNIEGKDTQLFTYVLNYMVQLYILDSMEEWMAVRDLRNAATHDYSQSEEVKAIHFHRLLQHVHYLFETLDKMLRFSAAAYSEQ